MKINIVSDICTRTPGLFFQSAIFKEKQSSGLEGLCMACIWTAMMLNDKGARYDNLHHYRAEKGVLTSDTAERLFGHIISQCFKIASGCGAQRFFKHGNKCGGGVIPQRLGNLLDILSTDQQS